MSAPVPPSGSAFPVAAALILAGVLASTVLFLPLILALPLGLLSAQLLRKSERVALVLLGVVYLATLGRGWTVEYTTWLLRFLPTRHVVGLFGGDATPISLWAAPWPEVVAMGIVISGVITYMITHDILHWHMGRRVKAGFEEDILPTAEEKQKAGTRLAKIPGESFLPDLAQEGGNRTFPLGYDRNGEPIGISEKEITTHGLIFGSTGSGKTETIKVIAGGLLDLGWSGMILDLKEDAQKGGLMDWCEIYGESHGIEYQSFRISDPEPKFWFNVLKGMGPDEARDTILASQEFEAAYYRALNERQLGQLVSLLYAAHAIDPVKHSTPTVYAIGKILAAPDVPALMRETVATVLANVPTFSRDDFDQLIRPDKATVEASGGLGARLTAMYETQTGRLALRGTDERPSFDVTRPGLSYVGLDSMGKPEITRLVAASVLRRMAVYAADRTNGKTTDKAPRFLIIDEANFTNRRLLLELLSRARSAGIACLVCTQGPTDWQAREAGEPDLASLAQNTNVSIVMSQGERTNAELCADLIGRGEKTRLAQRVAVRKSGLDFSTLRSDEGNVMDTATATTEEDYLVSPDRLRALEVGEAIVRVGKPLERRAWLRVVVRDPRSVAVAGVDRKRSWQSVFGG